MKRSFYLLFVIYHFLFVLMWNF